jgi:hypothetical protein
LTRGGPPHRLVGREGLGEGFRAYNLSRMACYQFLLPLNLTRDCRT